MVNRICSHAKYGVTFVGYSARVLFARKHGLEDQCAMLDFVSGGVLISVAGGFIWVSSHSDLFQFIRTLPELASQLEDLLCQRSLQASQQNTELAAGSEDNSKMVKLACGRNSVSVEPGTNIKRFIRQMTKRYKEIARILEQAEEIGSRIKRRPYQEYIDEIERTGVCRVEAHGWALFIRGKLEFCPDYKVGFVRPAGGRMVEVHTLDGNSNNEFQSMN
jgi:hypothetical protein